MPLLIAVETLDLGLVWRGMCLGHIAYEWSLSVGPRTCASIHWYGYVIKIPRGVGRIILGARYLRGRGILSPILIGSLRGALVLIRARTHGGESIAKGDIDAIPSVSGVDGRLS